MAESQSRYARCCKIHLLSSQTDEFHLLRMKTDENVIINTLSIISTMSNKMNKPQANKDYWHYPRIETARKLVNVLNIGAVHSFVIFAPRRIGKTEFLLQDLKPLAIDNHYHVLYFNFHADKHNQDSVDSFIEQLRFELDSGFLSSINITEINLPWCKINLAKQSIADLDVTQLLSLLVAKLEKKHKKLLLLLDEIQELAFKRDHTWFIGALRTALDVNKQNISVVFTGSSRAGLVNMFQESKAPFFHFSANFEFDYFGKEFTDYLANKFQEITHTPLNKDELYQIFCKLGRITLYIRELINTLILNPGWTLDEALNYNTQELAEPQRYAELWGKFSDAEKAILLGISSGNQKFYTQKFSLFADGYQLTVNRSKVQYALKKLTSTMFIIKLLNENYQINDSFFQDWIVQQYITTNEVSNVEHT